MALVYIDSDPWLLDHESCEKLYRQIVEQLNLRSFEDRSSRKYAEISALIRLQMKQFGSEIQQLQSKLKQPYSLTVEEAERRQRLVETLLSLHIQLRQRFNSRSLMDNDGGPQSVFNSTGDRERLLSSTAAFQPVSTTGWASDDDDASVSQPLLHEASVSDLKYDHKRLLRDQDDNLERLSKVISRQKDISVTIGSEIDLQNEIVDDLADRMERTNVAIERETAHVSVITRKDSTWGYWMIILLLFFAILAVMLL